MAPAGWPDAPSGEHALQCTKTKLLLKVALHDNLNKKLSLSRYLVASNSSSSDQGGQGQVAIYFEDIEKELIDWIGKQQCIWGCQMYLTSEPVLEALMRVPLVFIICSDKFMKDYPEYSKKVRDRYLEINSKQGAVGICDAGIYLFSSEAADSRRLLHHKFLVGSTRKSECLPQYGERIIHRVINELDPSLTVFTGSYNLSKSASENLETAIVIKCDKHIAGQFACEFDAILALGPPEVRLVYPEKTPVTEIDFATYQRLTTSDLREMLYDAEWSNLPNHLRSLHRDALAKHELLKRNPPGMPSNWQSNYLPWYNA